MKKDNFRLVPPSPHRSLSRIHYSGVPQIQSAEKRVGGGVATLFGQSFHAYSWNRISRNVTYAGFSGLEVQ